MKKLISFLIKAALCLLVLYVGVQAGNKISEYINPWESKAPVELTEFGSPHKFYYDGLSDIEKHAYNEILKNVYDMPESIRIPQITEPELKKIFSALLYDNPDLFFVGRKCSISSTFMITECSLEYIVDIKEYMEQKAELEEKCGEVISSLTAPDDEWQTELEIHDYIVENCDYKLEEGNLAHSSAYGALVNGEAACEGYSKAAKLLFDMAGIESAVVSGVSENDEGEGPHMWNAVKIDGEFYHLDCTWDDPTNSKGEKLTIYAYFNLNDEMIKKSHSDFSYKFKCTATAANYYEKTGSYFGVYDRSSEKKIADIIAKELENGGRFVQLRFGSKQVYNDAVSDLIDGGRIYHVLRRAKDKTDVEFSMNSLAYFKNSDQQLLTLVIER